jgi:outer membrane protein assembly factor BamB
MIWEQQVLFPSGRTELERLIDFGGQPLLVGADLYVAGYQGAAAALDRSRGSAKWVKPVSSAGQFAFADGDLFLTLEGGFVLALKMATGREIWENRELFLRQVTSPAVIGDYVAVADADGYIHLLDRGSGQFAGRYNVRSGGVRNRPLSDGETLYVLTNKGKLTALTVER